MTEEYKTYEEALEAVKEHPYTITELPEKFLTNEMYLAAAENDGGCTLTFMSKEAMTYEICMAAVSNDGTALCLVPDDYVSYAMCLAAVRSGVTEDDGYTSISYVPKRFITPGLCMESVTITPLSIQYIDNPSLELRLAAVRRNGCALEVIEDQTEEICIAAVENNGDALEFVKPEFKTYKVCNTALLSTHNVEYVLNYVPDKIKNQIILKQINRIKNSKN
jgi:hypothetical protein